MAESGLVRIANAVEHCAARRITQDELLDIIQAELKRAHGEGLREARIACECSNDDPWVVIAALPGYPKEQPT